ncbi:MAG: hypothetical protein JWR20_1493, partial [Marmoricola sp.]|nr:hypothetical protein [Marmoricola sp.]
RHLGALLAGVLGPLLMAGCDSSAPQRAAPEVDPTPIADLRTQTMTLPRIDFCSLVPTRAVGDALGGRAQARQTWGNGDRLALRGVQDTVAESGCAWSRSDGATTTARAWVFARPVEQADAGAVVARAGTVRGCAVPSAPATPAYGSPTVTQLCSSPAVGLAAGEQRVRHAGLFGTTWLTCELQGPASGTLRSRADAWCVEVANALDTAR